MKNQYIVVILHDPEYHMDESSVAMSYDNLPEAEAMAKEIYKDMAADGEAEGLTSKVGVYQLVKIIESEV